MNLDGVVMASSSFDETIKIFDAISGSKTGTLEGNSAANIGEANLNDDIAFSPDGTKLAVASGHTLQLWNVAEGTEIFAVRVTSSNAIADSVAFAPSGQAIAVGVGKSVKIYDTKTQSVMKTLSHSDDVTDIDYSPDGRTLASSSRDNTVKVWNVDTGAVVRTLSHSSGVLCVAFSPDGTMIASGTTNPGGVNVAKIWDAETGAGLATFTTHASGITCVTFSPDSSKLATGSGDETIKIWDVETKSQIYHLESHTDEITSVFFSPDGNQLISGSYDNKMKVWDMNTGKIIKTIAEHGNKRIHSVAFSPASKEYVHVPADKTYTAIAGNESGFIVLTDTQMMTWGVKNFGGNDISKEYFLVEKSFDKDAIITTKTAFILREKSTNDVYVNGRKVEGLQEVIIDAKELNVTPPGSNTAQKILYVLTSMGKIMALHGSNYSVIKDLSSLGSDFESLTHVGGDIGIVAARKGGRTAVINGSNVVPASSPEAVLVAPWARLG